MDTSSGWSTTLEIETQTPVTSGAASALSQGVTEYVPSVTWPETGWAHLKKSLANLTKRTVDQLAWLIRSRLTRIRYQPQLIAGFLAMAGLDFKPHNSHLEALLM
jgi:putative transposase